MTSPVDLLLAEDNAADAELTLVSLAEVDLGQRVHVARDGEAALAFLFDGSNASEPALPRLIVLDVKLPKIDGFELLRAIREHERTRAVPVVVFTSSNVESDIARAYDLGANSYVQKPVDFAEFRAAVQTVGRYWLQMNAPRRRSSAAQDRP